MKPVPYPFAAIVGQEQMKLALLLAAVDWRLGVLLRGDKGAGKTTTARGLAMLLPEPAPFVNLPIGVTEDRLLGGLHLESTLKGVPSLKPGLLSEAHGGVLYIDEVNLLPGHLGDALLDAAASGVHVIEREGFSASHPAEFVLLGSMNPEEGSVRPQLQDRFALSVDISASLDLQERQAIVERRIAFDNDPVQFVDEWSGEQRVWREKIVRGRERVSSIRCSGEILAQIGAAVCDAGVRSLRADLAAVRASIACAALAGDAAVEQHHVEAVLPLVLNHRARAGGRSMPQPPASHPQPEPGAQDQSTRGAIERIFAPQEVASPAVHVAIADVANRGVSQAADSDYSGPVVRTRLTESPREIDLRATLSHAVRETGVLQPRLASLHEKVRTPKSGIRYLFLIDSSGSHAAQEKMRRVKGAVLSLLDRSFRKGDEVSIISFRGTDARVLLEPARHIEDAATVLEYLPTGGRTPLAHALELAATYLTPSTFLVVLTDGRANVSLRSRDPWVEALEIAGQLCCRALVINTANLNDSLQRAPELADALKTSFVNLDSLAEIDLLDIR
jgi:magnesium chelatase subunit D